MWNFLGSLIKSFLLLRDFFGYVIPGAVLIFIVARCVGQVDLSHPPLAANSIAITAVILVTASYVVGHVLAAIGYSLYVWFDKGREKLKVPRQPPSPAPTDARNPKQPSSPSPSDANVLYYRYLYPSMFIEADRRETLTIFRVGLAVALLAGGFLPHSHLVQALTIAAGLFMLWNGYVSDTKWKAYRTSTVDAARLAKANNIPIFHWSGDSGDDETKDSKPADAAGKGDTSPDP